MRYKIFYLFLVASVYGFHNLKVNAQDYVTVTVLDTIDITGNFESSGASASAILYYDMNGNHLLDATDPWLLRYRFIDGGFNDEDELPNGNYHERTPSPPYSGNFLLYVIDGGVSDTVAITVTFNFSSNFSITGTIINPPNTPHLLVSLADISLTTGEVKMSYGAFTDNTGHYFIRLPNELGNRNWDIAILDVAGVAPDYMDWITLDILINGNITHNDSMKFLGGDTSSYVWGNITDENGNPLGEPIHILAGCVDANAQKYGGRQASSAPSGRYGISLYRISGPSGYGVSASVSDQFYPKYMNPAPAKAYFPVMAPESINLNLKAYTTNSTISGYVYKEGSPYDKAIVHCGSKVPTNIGGNYAKTFSDGHYSIPVSTAADTYCVTLAKESIPPNYELAPPGTLCVPPGATNVNFYLVGVEEKPYTTVTIKIYPNPVTRQIIIYGTKYDVENLLLYDITGKKVFEIKPQIHRDCYFILNNIPSGIYFYSLRVKNNIYKGKIVKF